MTDHKTTITISELTALIEGRYDRDDSIRESVERAVNKTIVDDPPELVPDLDEMSTTEVLRWASTRKINHKHTYALYKAISELITAYADEVAKIIKGQQEQ